MTDVDSRLTEILPDSLAEPVQELVDVLVAEETAELTAALEEKEESFRTLSSTISKLRKTEEELRLALRKAYNSEDDDEYEHLKKESAADALAEMARQDAKWGPARQQPNGTGESNGYTSYLAWLYQQRTDTKFANGTGSWADILLEEVYEALAEHNTKKLKEELIQVAAVCLSWVTSLKLQKPRQ